MLDRRTFLKLSAGALVLTAAGALTGCGQTEDTALATVSVGDVVLPVHFRLPAAVLTGRSPTGQNLRS